MVLAGIAGLAISLITTPPLTLDPTLPLKPSLPDDVGEYVGEAFSFCQDLQCLRSRSGATLESDEPCPDCGGEMAVWSVGERQALPPDSILLRRQYVSPGGDTYQVGAVMSGVSRKALHNPNLCLKGMGYQIGERAVEQLDMRGARPHGRARKRSGRSHSEGRNSS